MTMMKNILMCNDEMTMKNDINDEEMIMILMKIWLMTILLMIMKK